MRRIRKTVKGIEYLPEMFNSLEMQGWVEKPFCGSVPVKNPTEKMNIYVWRWRGEWSGYQKGYCTTFYR